MSSPLTVARPKARGHCQKQTADATPDIRGKTTVFEQAWGDAAESGAPRLERQALLKGKRPGMADRAGHCFRRRRCTDLPERSTGLINQKLDDVAGAVPTERAKTPKEGLTRKCRMRSKRQRPHHIGAAAYAAIHQDRGPVPDLGGDCRQHVDRG